MSLKLRYFFFIFFIHVVLTILAFQLLKEERMYFLLAEFGILCSLVAAYSIYRSFIKPVDFIASGTNAIADKDFNVKFVKTGALEMDRLVEVYNQMIDNIRKERLQVEEQHYFLEKLIHASPAGIIILDYDDRLAEVNPKAVNMLRLEQGWQQKRLSEINNEALQLMSDVEVGQSKVISVKGMDLYKCEVSNFVHLGFERKFILFQEMSKEILAAEKRAYGKVIRMMAHEVNNSIGAINSIMTSSLDYLKEEEGIDEDVKSALQIAINRNDRLNLFMRNFAEVIRLPKPTLLSADLNSVILGVAKLMEPQAKDHQIDYQYELAEEKIILDIDVEQIEQVLINALKNAREAIGQNGTIRLITSKNPPHLIIADSGSGVGAEVQDKLFTPFFSTKMDGQGLGLTLSKEIILNHDGKLSLQTVGEWTEFKVEF